MSATFNLATVAQLSLTHRQVSEIQSGAWTPTGLVEIVVYREPKGWGRALARASEVEWKRLLPQDFVRELPDGGGP